MKQFSIRRFNIEELLKVFEMHFADLQIISCTIDGPTGEEFVGYLPHFHRHRPLPSCGLSVKFYTNKVPLIVGSSFSLGYRDPVIRDCVDIRFAVEEFLYNLKQEYPHLCNEQEFMTSYLPFLEEELPYNDWDTTLDVMRIWKESF